MNSAASLPVHRIAPSRTWVPLGCGELWAFRDLLYFLVWRELKVRYKQAALGAAWAIIQPLSTMVVFTVFFGRLAKMPSDGVPYPVFAFCALLPWQLFAFALSESTNSVVTNQRLVTKVYFPRLILPLAAVSVGLLDFVVSLAVLIAMLAYYGIVPGMAVLTLPLWTALALTTACGVGLWLSALNARYRDIRYTVPFVTQMWLFVTPVAYPTSIVPEAWRPLFSLNPMVSVVEGFRWSLIPGASAPGMPVVVSAAVVVLLLVSGLFYFRRVERTFADIV